MTIRTYRSSMLMLFALISNGQTLTQNVLSGSGSSGSGSWGSLAYTFGEVVGSTGTVGNTTFTQGFHQPQVVSNIGVVNYNLNASIVFYPNPTDGLLNLSTSLKEGRISVYDEIGQLVFEADELPEQLDLGSFQTGIYHINLSSINLFKFRFV
ncbi:MAG: hypothetical protein ACI8ZN_001477 [Bacteroidia bacterium]|jgi:hypothetical protein